MTNQFQSSPEQMKRLLELSNKVLSEELRNQLHPVTMFGVADPHGEGYLFARLAGLPGQLSTFEVLIGGVGLRHGMDLYQGELDKEQGRDRLSMQAMIRASCVSRKALAPFEAKVYDELGYQPLTPGQWPQFHTFRPGRPPTALLPQDLERLVVVMEQAEILTARAPSEPALHETVAENQHLLLVRAPARKQRGRTYWVDRWKEPELAEYNRLPVLDEVRVQRLVKDFPQSEDTNWEADAFFGTVTVERTTAPSEDWRVVPAVDGEEEMAPLGRFVAICDPKKEKLLKLGIFSLEQSWAELQDYLLGSIEIAHERPRYLAVLRPDVYSALVRLCEALDIELVTPDRLPVIEAVRTYVKQEGSELFRSQNI